jgi:hypothetical protein
VQRSKFKDCIYNSPIAALQIIQYYYLQDKHGNIKITFIENGDHAHDLDISGSERDWQTFGISLFLVVQSIGMGGPTGISFHTGSLAILVGNSCNLSNSKQTEEN